MNGFLTFRRFNFLTLFFGFFMLAVMAGCVQVETTCSSGCCGQRNTDTPPPGACNSWPTGTYTGSANGFWNTATGQIWTGSGNCTSGKRCNPNSPPGYGRCGSGAACKNWVTPSNMACKCDCNP
jgi:hypothetical protein